MRGAAILLITTLAGWPALAQYKPVDQGSTVAFTIKNLGFAVKGSFSGLDGLIRFDPAHPDDAGFDVSIDAATVNTDNSMRDDHLRKESFFDVKNYQRIRLTSTKVLAAKKPGTWILVGKLTIKNHTRDISFPFSATASGGGYLFSGQFALNRKDFDIGGGPILSDELQVTLLVLAK
jgi:polyisoprenoid-binding protein YceI